jgi:hypothetical protein
VFIFSLIQNIVLYQFAVQYCIRIFQLLTASKHFAFANNAIVNSVRQFLSEMKFFIFIFNLPQFNGFNELYTQRFMVAYCIFCLCLLESVRDCQIRKKLRHASRKNKVLTTCAVTVSITHYCLCFCSTIYNIFNFNIIQRKIK